jgi:hypothetical protein
MHLHNTVHVTVVVKGHDKIHGARERCCLVGGVVLAGLHDVTVSAFDPARSSCLAVAG